MKFFRKKSVYYALGVLGLAAVGFFIFGGNDTTAETVTVRRADFVNEVSVSGKVNTVSSADLGFASSGRIGRISVKNNQNVRKGQLLAQLEIADLLAELRIKEVNLKTSGVDLNDARENVEKVTTQENTKVESAYRKLLTEDLALIPDTSYAVETPEISGIYDGAEGQYKIRIKKEEVTSRDITLRTFGAEDTRRIINEEGPTPLGTRGLLISFPEDLVLYDDTTWYLDIPNKAGDSYLANYNAYNEAKKARDLAIRNAEYELEKLLTKDSSGQSSVTLAEIDKIRSDIRKSSIYAPFDGIVTNIDKEVGEVIAANDRLLTVLDENSFEIESFIPEVNIARIETGDTARVTLDAYGENVVFDATVVAIDPAETIRDGISTYKVKLQFAEKDPRIKSGMTANVSILIFEKPDAIALPGGTVFEKAGKHFVEVKSDDKITEREVTLGETSSLGQVEILSGLEVGEEVVLKPSGAK